MTGADLDVALAMAPPSARPALTALFALDTKLGEIVASTTETMIGQLRLAWWREALERLDREDAPAEPLLRQLQAALPGTGINGATLAKIIDGWEHLLLTDPADRPAREAYAAGRGGNLFAAAASILGADHPAMRQAGEGWALAKLGNGDAILAEQRFAAAFAASWPPAVRPLGVLALLARFDMNGRSRPLRHLGALLRFRMMGR